VTGEAIAGRYRLLEQLGHGAMSTVWLAHDDELDRDVALKVLSPTADRARFEREARAVAALSHPNISGLYDYGESDGRPYMVLEYLPGGTLEDRLAGGRPLPDAETARYADEVAAGLAHAHAQGVVHRDLKPANVLFDSEGRAKIADFGIAPYISPEQAAGLPATAASDVYSFGTILFRMLTGRLPFVSSNAMELVRMNRDEQPPAVADLRTGAPPVLAFTADASLAKDPLARPADGAVLLATLHDDTAQTQVLAPPPQKRRCRYLVPLVVLAVLLLGGAALALALTSSTGDSGGTDATGSLSLPSVPAATSTTQTTPATTAVTTTAPTTTRTATTAPATTASTTTHRTTTTHPATTVVSPPPPTTTFATTTVATTDTTATDTTATTTAAATDQSTTTAASP